MGIRQEFVCDSGDINAKGEEMGFEWNTICDWIRKTETYADDGAGYFYICHSSVGGNVGHDDLQKVIDALLDDANLTEVKVIE